jgi:hypothetical protein
MEDEVEGQTHAQTDYRNLAEPPFRQGQITPILSSPWVEKKSNKLLRRFISRVFLDVFSLQIFLGHPGEIVLEKLGATVQQLLTELSEIKEKINNQTAGETESPDNDLQSDCLCYWIEFVDPDEIQANADKIFEKIFDSADFQVIDFSFARVAFAEDGQHIGFCILVRDVKKAAIFFNDLLPEYFLSWSKVKNEEGLLKQKFIEEEKEKLNNLLEEKSSRQSRSLRQLEKINFELSEKRTAFAEKLLDMEFHLRTLEINISNAEKLLHKNLLTEQKELLTELWVKPLRLVAEQTGAFISYYRIMLEKSRISGEKITNDVNLKSAIYSRQLTFLFGLFSLIGILQLFPDSFGKIGEYQKVLVILITILIFLAVAFQNEIKDWFSDES